MRRLLGAALLVAALPAAAQPPEPAPALPPDAARAGYAVAQPPVLLRQRLFGIAHGISLLAAACLDVPEQASAAQDAYGAWREKHDAAISILFSELAAWHFGPRGVQADWTDVARALSLKDSLDPMPGAIELNAACASLPEALTRARYDLTALRQLTPEEAAAVLPAPTLPK